MDKVYVRDFKTRSIVREIDVSDVASTSEYYRFVMGLMRNMDLDNYYLDDEDYLKDEEGGENNGH